MLRCDLSIDPVTGLPNLFGLLESAHTVAFGVHGAVVVADIAEMAQINTVHGRKAGDACIRGLAGLLRAETQPSQIHSQAGIASVAFRIGGDEFILILPEASQEHAEEVAKSIQEHYHRRMQNQGIPSAVLHIAVHTYNFGEHSGAKLLKAAYLALDVSKHGLDVSNCLPPWAEKLIDIMVDRICDTVAMVRETRTLALSDEISRLPNHRAAELFLDDMLNEYETQGEPCSVLLVDGDNLRLYNDMGYQRGNQMIRDLAHILSSSLRYGDRVARWLSGDEFVVLLPGADRQTAIQVAERLRAAVEIGSYEWPAPITVSVGVATCPVDGISADQLMRCAEERNNIAKKAGKNQVS